jgi:hypothetical protein
MPSNMNTSCPTHACQIPCMQFHVVGTGLFPVAWLPACSPNSAGISAATTSQLLASKGWQVHCQDTQYTRVDVFLSQFPTTTCQHNGMERLHPDMRLQTGQHIHSTLCNVQCM